MSIGRNRKAASFAFRGPHQVARQIHPFRAGVNFKSNAAFGGPFRHALEIIRVCFALQKDAPGTVTQDLQRRRFQRPQQAVGHFGRFQMKVAVNAADHQIEFGQSVFGDIHRSVAQNIALQAGKNVQRKSVTVHLANFPRKGHHPVFIQAVSHRERL